MAVRWGIVACAIALLASRAHANEPPHLAETSTADTSDPAWIQYDNALRALSAEQRSDSLVRLRTIVTQYPDHPAAVRARTLIEELTAEANTREARGSSNRVARGELVFWSTASSLFLTSNICEVAGCESNREYAIASTLTVGSVLGATVYLSRWIRPGQAQLYNSAQTWAAWNSLAINDGFADTRGEAGTAIALQAAGVGAAAGLWETWRPSSGDVALTNTFYIWGTLIGVWTQLALYGEEDEYDNFLRNTVLIGDAAIVAGAALSTQVEVSRGRTLLIDTGGLLGTLLGGLIALAGDSSKTVGGAFAVGTGAGLAVAAYATEGWDTPITPVPVAPTVVRGPDSVGVGLGTTFAW
jgi:hypothetical protein